MYHIQAQTQVGCMCLITIYVMAIYLLKHFKIYFRECECLKTINESLHNIYVIYIHIYITFSEHYTREIKGVEICTFIKDTRNTKDY